MYHGTPAWRRKGAPRARLADVAAAAAARRRPGLEQLRWAPHCPAALRALATACLDNDPQARPPFARLLCALQHMLLAACQPAPAPPPCGTARAALPPLASREPDAAPGAAQQRLGAAAEGGAEAGAQQGRQAVPGAVAVGAASGVAAVVAQPDGARLDSPIRGAAAGSGPAEDSSSASARVSSGGGAAFRLGGGAAQHAAAVAGLGLPLWSPHQPRGVSGGGGGHEALLQHLRAAHVHPPPAEASSSGPPSAPSTCAWSFDPVPSSEVFARLGSVGEEDSGGNGGASATAAAAEPAAGVWAERARALPAHRRSGGPSKPPAPAQVAAAAPTASTAAWRLQRRAVSTPGSAPNGTPPRPSGGGAAADHTPPSPLLPQRPAGEAWEGGGSGASVLPSPSPPFFSPAGSRRQTQPQGGGRVEGALAAAAGGSAQVQAGRALLRDLASPAEALSAARPLHWEESLE